jgi:hypothetical protein
LNKNKLEGKMVKHFIMGCVFALAAIYPFFAEGIDRANCYLGAIVIMIAYKTFLKKEKGGNNG